MYRIFIVEDHPLMRDAYCDMLNEEADMEVAAVASSGEEALEKLAESAPDLVLVDLSLPGMSGYELISKLQSRYPALPALVVSGHPATQYQQLTRRSGAAGYVNKTEVLDTLAPTIRTLLSGAEDRGDR